MKKKVGVLLSSFGMIAVSIILLLVFFISKNVNDVFLYCSASDLEIHVGDTVYDFYEVSKENAKISFSVDKENIVVIDENKIYGNSSGEVKVVLTARLGEEKSEVVFHVKVYAENYRVEFSPIVDCYLEGNTLYAQSKISQFKFDIYDALNNKLTNIRFEVIVEGDASIVKNFQNIMLQMNENSKLTFRFIDLDFEITINTALT